MSAAAPTIAAEVDEARQAVRLTIEASAGADTLDVWRVATETGHVAYVRGWQGRAITGTSVLLYDWEVPLGVEVTYYARSYDGAVASATGSAAALTVDDERDWLVDLARPTNTMPILVESLPELVFEGPVGVHRVLDRRDPILTTAALWTPAGVLSFFTLTELERDRARTILGAGLAFLLRTPPERGVGNIYLGLVRGMREQRPSRLAQHWERRFVAEVVQVERPDPTVFVPLAPLTYAERSDLFATYADATATGKSYQEIAYTFPADRVDPVPPWLPDDV